jgi:hypothetical protein
VCVYNQESFTDIKRRKKASNAESGNFAGIFSYEPIVNNRCCQKNNAWGQEQEHLDTLRRGVEHRPQSSIEHIMRALGRCVSKDNK